MAKRKIITELNVANKELAFQDNEKEKRAAELVIANKELAFQNNEKEKRAEELIIANKELAFQNDEKEKRAAELSIANKELAFQSEVKEKRAAELVIANKELAFQNDEKEKRAAELVIANKELAFQNDEKEKRAAELVIANKELLFQNNEKEKRAEELIIANKELAFQNDEKSKRAAELVIANKELAFENDLKENTAVEKEKRAEELIIANKELAFQNKEKEKRAAELVIANKELDFQNIEKGKRVIENRKLEASSSSAELASQYSRSLIEASLDPLVTISVEGKITDVNEASIKVTGVSREELIGNDFSNYFTEPEKAQQGYEQVFDKGFVADYPLTIKHKNGRLTDVLYNASVYKDLDGNVIGVFAAARDVTAQKQIEKNLANSLEEVTGYKYALDMSSIVAITDEKGIINYANDNFAKVSKYSQEELLGKNHSILNSGFHPKEFMANLWKTIQKGNIWKGEVKNRAKDGSHYWVDTTIVPFRDVNGKIYQYVAVRTDITAKKLSSQYSRSIIEASLDPLFTINTDGKITDVNNASVKMTGVERDKLIDTDFFEYFTEPLKAHEGYKEVFANGFITNYSLVIKDHKLTDVLLNGSVYRDEQENVMGVVIVARDVTEQKKFATELLEAKVFAEFATELAEDAKMKAESAARIAEDAVKAKQQFLSNMSHEIRTPMNAIIGFTKVVLKTELNVKQKEYLDAIKMSGDALIVLINDILDLAKVDAGKMTFEQTPFKMFASLSAMLHLFETKIQEKNLVLVKEYDEQIPEVLIGDPVRLHQIILNLVSNAVKFTSEGKITVGVRVLEQNEAKANIEFSISDTGIGITENKIDKIFENFQQASSGTSRLYGGTGLGLAIVKQLVESQGGSIKVESTIGKGSVFSFILSFQKTLAKPEPEIEQLELDVKNRNIKVLVVEDIALNQLLMKTLLDDFGFERDIAGNGKIAIEKLKLKSYDIILMDLQMPEMNGFEATDYIRNTLNSKIPIIALTADVTTVDLAKCTAVGMNDYISKPVDEKILYSKIVGLVKKPVQIKLVAEKEIALDKESKYIDLTYLTNRTKSNPQLMMEMISLYLEQTPPLILTMKRSLQEKDWKNLHSAAHKMIPSFSIMGMSVNFENMAKKIQEHASQQQQEDTIHNLVIELENVCTQACKELEEEYKRIKSTIK
jgi:PAS domain S-box-containing protein